MSRNYNSPKRKMKLAIWEAAGWECSYCGIEIIDAPAPRQPPNAATVDHVLPLSKGGKNTASNLVAACYACNQARRDFAVIYVLEQPKVEVRPARRAKFIIAEESARPSALALALSEALERVG